MNLLIKNVTLVPMDKKNDILENTNIYILNNKIEHIGYLSGDL